MFRFSQEMWKGLTGRGLYHNCDSQCLNYSQPCKGKCMPGTHRFLQIKIDINKTKQNKVNFEVITIFLGYWLCHTGTECILSSTTQRGTNMTSLCDGKLDCVDRSDEAWLVCLQVCVSYFEKRIQKISCFNMSGVLIRCHFSGCALHFSAGGVISLHLRHKATDSCYKILRKI